MSVWLRFYVNFSGGILIIYTKLVYDIGNIDVIVWTERFRSEWMSEIYF